MHTHKKDYLLTHSVHGATVVTSSVCVCLSVCHILILKAVLFLHLK